MMDRLHLSTILLVASVIWGVLLVLDGVVVSIGWLHHLSIVTGVVLLLLAAFDVFLWRLPVLHPWSVKRPMIDGTWRASLVSNWIEPVTHQTISTISGYMVVRQTFSKLSLRLITAESRSELLGAEILRAGDGPYRVTGIYRNEPKHSFRDRSPIHYGGLVLQVLGAPPNKLEGHHWTDRNTAGEIVFSEQRRIHADDLISAKALYGEANG